MKSYSRLFTKHNDMNRRADLFISILLYRTPLGCAIFGAIEL